MDTQTQRNINERLARAYQEVTKKSKDKGDMDGDGRHEPDDQEYLDNKDKAIKKALKHNKEGVKDINTKNADAAVKHDCASHVEHVKWGLGDCIEEQHTIVETVPGVGYVTHYDVMFEHGVERDVPVEDLKILAEKHHGHMPKKRNSQAEDATPVSDHDPRYKDDVNLPANKKKKKSGDEVVMNPKMTTASKSGETKEAKEDENGPIPGIVLRDNRPKHLRGKHIEKIAVGDEKAKADLKKRGLLHKKESTIRSKLISVLENKDKHTKGATKPEMMDDKLKGQGAKDMAKPAQDAIAAEPTIDEPDRIKKDMAKMTANVKVSKKRNGDNKSGDLKAVNPNPIKDPAAMKSENTHHNILDAYKSMYEVSRKGETPSMNPFGVTRKGEKASSSNISNTSSSVSRKGEKISMNPFAVSRKGEVPQSKLKPNPGADVVKGTPTQTRKPSGPPTQTRKPSGPPPAPKVTQPKGKYGPSGYQGSQTKTSLIKSPAPKVPTQTRKPSGPPPAPKITNTKKGDYGMAKDLDKKQTAGSKEYSKKPKMPPMFDPSKIVPTNTKGGQKDTSAAEKMKDIKDRMAARRQKMKDRLNNPTYKSNLIKKYVLKPRSTRD